MVFRCLADVLVAFHLLFVAFVVFGGLLALRWPRAVWIHLPAVAWGAWVEYAGRICPLTPLELQLRAGAGQAGYPGGFIEHYLLPLLYPAGLTRPSQWLIGSLVLGGNGILYAFLLWRSRRRRLAS